MQESHKKMAKRALSAKVSKRRPRVSMIVACDSAARDPNSGKATLYGVFDVLYVKELPSKVAFTAYCKIVDGNGRWLLGVNFFDPNGKTTALAMPTLEADCGDGKRSEMAIVGMPIEIKRLGRHKLRVVADGKPLDGELDVLVQLLPNAVSK